MSLKKIKGIGPATEEKLSEAGIETVQDLAAANAADLSEATGVAESRLQGFIKRAKAQAKVSKVADQAEDMVEQASDSAAEAARRAVERSVESLENARVVITEGMERARIKVQDDVVAELPILTARAKENAEQKLDGFKGNVIVLKERTDTALLRMEEEIYEGLPLFKEKLDEGTDEVRVRVREIRERRIQPAIKTIGEKLKGIFSRN